MLKNVYSTPNPTIQSKGFKVNLLSFICLNVYAFFTCLSGKENMLLNSILINKLSETIFKYKTRTKRKF